MMFEINGVYPDRLLSQRINLFLVCLAKSNDSVKRLALPFGKLPIVFFSIDTVAGQSRQNLAG